MKFYKKSILLVILLGINFIATVYISNAETTQDIPTEQEYVSGTITDFISNMSYVWVNSSDSSFISLTMYDKIYKIAPFYPFFGQSFKVDEEEFFVGTTIAGFELYEDLNDNQVLDQANELTYFIMTNASQDFILPTVKKSVNAQDDSVYSWKISYFEIDGHIMNYVGDAKVLIDSFNLSYAFTVSENSSELKLDIEMGAWDAYEFSWNPNPPYNTVRGDTVDLSDLSLSILLGTTVSSESPFDVTYTNTSNGFIDNTILVNDNPIYKSSFTDTYDLGLNGSSYEALTLPAEINTLLEDQILNWNMPSAIYTWWGAFFDEISDLTSLPTLGVEEASLLYRICYPVWNGEPFIHDPRYKAIFSPDSVEPTTTAPSATTEGTTITTVMENTESGPDEATPGFLYISLIFSLAFFAPLLSYFKKRR